MKQFNLQDYLKNPNRKVVTRDSRNVKILYTNAKNEYNQPIVALIEERDGNEKTCTYCSDGSLIRDGEARYADLFFAPIKHEDWVNVYCDDIGDYYYGGTKHSTEQKAKRFAKGDDRYITTIKIEWEE